METFIAGIELCEKYVQENSPKDDVEAA